MQAKISLSTHLLAYYRFHDSFPEILREAGFINAEIWCMNPHFAYGDLDFVERAFRRFEAAGVTPRSVHLPFYLHLDLLRKGEKLSPLDPNPQAREACFREGEAAILAAQALGAKVAVLHLGEPGAALDPQNESLALAAIDRLAGFAASRHITIALENIVSQLTAIPALQELIAKSGHPNLGICLDIGHSNVFASPQEDLRLAAPTLANTHLHDNDGSADQHRPPGEGSIDWRQLAAQFRDAGYGGWHALEIRDESRGGADPGHLVRSAAVAAERSIPILGDQQQDGSSPD